MCSKLSIPRFTLSQDKGKSQAQVIDLTVDDEDEPRSMFIPPVPMPVAKKPRRASPSPFGNPPSQPRVVQPNGNDTNREGRFEDSSDHGEALWVDLHAPETEVSREFELIPVYTNISLQGALAVHPKKVEDVRRWLGEALTGGPTGKLRRYRVNSSSFEGALLDYLRTALSVFWF